MMSGNVALLDTDLSHVKVENTGNRKGLKMRLASFTSVSKKFNDFRINLLNKKLEAEKKAALSEKYVANADGYITEKDEDRMMKRAKVVARLEEKIKILSGEDVPVDYVNRRAIKIKRAMMDNITKHSVTIYTVGNDNADEIFGKTAVQSNETETILDDKKFVSGQLMKNQRMPEISEEQFEGYVPGAVLKSEIRSAVDEAFDELMQVEDKPEIVEDTPHINLEEIKNSIEDAFNEQAINSESEATIGPEIIQDVVGETIDLVSEDEKISLENTNVEIDNTMDYAVSKNGSSQAKLDRFNEDGTEKERDSYVPLTDEQVKSTQANIEFDKYEQIYTAENENENENAFDFKTAEFKDIFKPAENNFNQFNFISSEPVQRDVPVIVSEIDENNRFIPIQEEAVKETTSVVSRPTSLEEFGELKAKVVELKKKLAESENRKNAAVQFATRTATRAEEVKKITIASEKEYQDRLTSLQLLAKTLEENCNLNDTAARTAAMDAECNERFISSQMTKKNQYDDAINQVDSILSYSEDVEQSEHRRRVA